MGEAKSIVQDYLNRHPTSDDGVPPVVTVVTESTHAWGFDYQDPRVNGTEGTWGFMLVGGPIIVDKEDGFLWKWTGSAHPVEFYLKEYETHRVGFREYPSLASAESAIRRAGESYVGIVKLCYPKRPPRGFEAYMRGTRLIRGAEDDLKVDDQVGPSRVFLLLRKRN